jgi:hypothetical protein
MWGRRIKGADEAAEEATWGSILLAQTFPKILPGEKYDKASVNEILEVKNKAKRIAQDLENGIDTFPSENLVEVLPRVEPIQFDRLEKKIIIEGGSNAHPRINRSTLNQFHNKLGKKVFDFEHISGPRTSLSKLKLL